MGLRDTVYFISDAHFGAGANEEERLARFCELAAEMRGRASTLYVAGDFFDFWIEYKNAIRPDYFPVLHELRTLADVGVETFYVTGNHDFAAGPLLEKTARIKVLHGCVDAVLQGRRVHISHGDKIGMRGVGRLANSMLRAAPFQAIYKTLHPNIGVPLGEFAASVSRKKNMRRTVPAEKLQRYRNSAARLLLSGRCDLVIYAHTHIAEFVTLDGGEYCNVGSFMEFYDYAILRGGKLQLLKWGNKTS